jgi:hypothetical protein
MANARSTARAPFGVLRPNVSSVLLGVRPRELGTASGRSDPGTPSNPLLISQSAAKLLVNSLKVGVRRVLRRRLEKIDDGRPMAARPAVWELCNKLMNVGQPGEAATVFQGDFLGEFLKPAHDSLHASAWLWAIGDQNNGNRHHFDKATRRASIGGCASRSVHLSHRRLKRRRSLAEE